METMVIKACNAEGECVPDTGDLCEPADYDPCSEKKCGDSCQVCPPDDTDCMETMVIKACNAEGECVPDTGDLCEPADYDPCSEKKCGDSCKVCPPDDTDCMETMVIKACNAEGQCVADNGKLCEAVEYVPCAEKKCGDVCTLCPPGANDCFETAVMKACNPEGQCVADNGKLCDFASNCEDSVLPAEGLMDSFDSFGGCGDIALYAMRGDGTMEMVLSVPGNLCQAAHDAGAALEKEYDLGDGLVSLKVRVGTNVSDATCDDALMPPPNEMKVEEEFSVQSGTLVIKVNPEGDPEPWSAPAKVTATLTNANFDDGKGCVSTVESFTWSDVFVGWFPG